MIVAIIVNQFIDLVCVRGPGGILGQQIFETCIGKKAYFQVLQVVGGLGPKRGKLVPTQRSSPHSSLTIAKQKWEPGMRRGTQPRELKGRIVEVSSLFH
jgi:hypothetical protein